MIINDYCEYMFKVPLLHLSVRNWDEKKQILLEMSKDTEMDNDNVKSDYHLQKNTSSQGKHNSKIEELLKEEINLFCGHFGFVYYKVVMSWFEQASVGNYHGVHNHGSVGYSSVCYIDYDSTVHTPTLFISPFNNFITGSSLHFAPPVDEGSIIFFPSAILHHTEPNKSNQQRTIVSFNIDVKEKYDQRPRYS